MIGLAAMAGALAASAPMSTEEAFDAFRTLCLGTAADPLAVVARADELGWRQVPDEARQRIASGADNPETSQVRALQAGDQLLVVTADRSARTVLGKPLSTNNCQLNVTGGDYAALLALAKAWAGVPANTNVGADPAKATAFIFTDENGQHESLTEVQLESATADFVRERRVTQLFVYNLSRGTSIRVGIPAK